MSLTPFRRAVLLGAAVLALAPAAPAGATSLVMFHLPSRNIGCALSGTFLRCDVNQTTDQLPARPRSCQLDYGHAFGLRETGRAMRLCVGDTAVDPGSRLLRYGHTWRHGGFACTATTAGLRCANENGHGFFLARERQQTF